MSSGGRDQEDHGSKISQSKKFAGPYLKKPFTKIGLVEWLKVKAQVQAPVPQKKKYVFLPCLNFKILCSLLPSLIR
jgi:hypothetical protein